MFIVTLSGGTSAAQSPTPTGLQIEPLVTATREAWSLASPTPTATEFIAEPLLTLTALHAMFEATFQSIPTATPGPSAIELTGKPHFVEFYADWCGPCRRMRPHLDRVIEKYSDQVTFWKIDVDNPGSQPLVVKYRVSSIPYMVMLDAEGNTLFDVIGFHEQPELEAIVERLLAITGQ